MVYLGTHNILENLSKNNFQNFFIDGRNILVDFDNLSMGNHLVSLDLGISSYFYLSDRFESAYQLVGQIIVVYYWLCIFWNYIE